MSRRRHSDSLVLGVVRVAGTLVLLLLWVWLMRGLIRGDIRPAEIAARIPHYWAVIVGTLPAVGISMTALAAVVLWGPLYDRLTARRRTPRTRRPRRPRTPHSGVHVPESRTAADVSNVVLLDGRPLLDGPGRPRARGPAPGSGPAGSSWNPAPEVPMVLPGPGREYRNPTGRERGWSLQIAWARMTVPAHYDSPAVRAWEVHGRWTQWNKNWTAA